MPKEKKVRNTRPISIYIHYEYKEFEEIILPRVQYLKEKYNYYINLEPVKITRKIEDIANDKDDWYKSRINVYYDKDYCYVAVYTKTFITIDVYLLEGKGNRAAYAILGKIKDVIKYEEKIELRINTKGME